MAKIYLDSGDTFTLSGAASVFGSTGTEKLIVNSGATGVVADQNVERVDLAGASSAYTFQQSGNQLKVFSGTTLVATIPVQDDTDGSQVVFTNGSVSAKISATGVMTLGGAAVTSTAAAVTPTTIDATVTSGSGTSTGTTVALTVGTTAPVAATPANEVFTLDVAAAKTSTPDTQITVNSFDVIKDALQIDLVTANATITKLSQLAGVEGIAVQTNPIANSTLINFGNDADGTVISVTLAGIVDTSLVNVTVI